MVSDWIRTWRSRGPGRESRWVGSRPQPRGDAACPRAAAVDLKRRGRPPRCRLRSPPRRRNALGSLKDGQQRPKVEGIQPRGDDDLAVELELQEQVPGRGQRPAEGPARGDDHGSSTVRTLALTRATGTADRRSRSRICRRPLPRSSRRSRTSAARKATCPRTRRRAHRGPAGPPGPLRCRETATPRRAPGGVRPAGTCAGSGCASGRSRGFRRPGSAPPDASGCGARTSSPTWWRSSRLGRSRGARKSPNTTSGAIGLAAGTAPGPPATPSIPGLADRRAEHRFGVATGESPGSS